MRAKLQTAAVVAGAALALAACGGDDSPQAEGTTGPDLTALRCPMVSTGEVGGVEQFEPAKNSFNTAELIGMTVPEARETAAGHGCEVVVALEDGRGQSVPLELDPKRIYVFTENDVVTYIEGVGGGL